MKHDTIGIDISKATLDVHRLSDGKRASFTNCARGFSQLADFCAQTDVVRVVYEATGAYHSRLVGALSSHIPMVRVNPLQARRFAQAQGVRAKTDAVDARMLALMGVAFKLEPDAPVTKLHQDLKDLRSFRLGLVKDRTRIVNRQRTQSLPIIRRQNNALLSQLTKKIAEIDEEISKLLNACEVNANSLKILRSIPGVGAVCAATILIEMPEIGRIARKQAASLAGLAPMTRESGVWKGKAFIQGGRKVVRNALYMPAIVAIRHNPDFKTKYQSMINAGKPPKVAIIAVMRKLIELANVLIKENRNWVKKDA